MADSLLQFLSSATNKPKTSSSPSSGSPNSSAHNLVNLLRSPSSSVDIQRFDSDPALNASPPSENYDICEASIYRSQRFLFFN